MKKNHPPPLKMLIKDNSLFFDKLIDLIPPKFYLSTDDEDNKPWFQGLSRTAKAAAKKQSRDNLKKARRSRLDPDNPNATTLGRLHERIDKVDDDDEAEEADLAKGDGTGDEREVTYEELRERLHRRIEALRGNRGSESTCRKRKMENQRLRDVKEGRRTDAVQKSDEGKIKTVMLDQFITCVC